MRSSIFPSRWPARLQTAAVYGLLLGNILWATVATKLLHRRERIADRKATVADSLIAHADSLLRCWESRRAVPCR